MQNKNFISIGNRKIFYQLKKNKRSKKIRISIHRDARVVVSQPFGITEKIIERFLKEKTDWIMKKVDYFLKNQDNILIKDNRKDYLEKKSEVLQFVQNRLKFFNQIYNFEYNRISIRNQKTRWGSCSSKGNLSFNYKLIYLTLKQADYIVVHELCHLKEMNHSNRFWQLVERSIPDYKNIRKSLKLALD